MGTARTPAGCRSLEDDEHSLANTPSDPKRNHQDMNETPNVKKASNLPPSPTTSPFEREYESDEDSLDIRLRSSQRMPPPKMTASATRTSNSKARNESGTQDLQASPPPEYEYTPDDECSEHASNNGGNLPEASKTPALKTKNKDASSRSEAISNTVDEFGLPEEAMDPFNWSDLELRYHAMIKECNEEEDMCWKRYGSLVDASCSYPSNLSSTDIKPVFRRLVRSKQDTRDRP